MTGLETSLSLSQSCHCHYHYVIITSLMIMIHRVIRCYWLLLSQSDWLKNTYLIRNNKEPPLSLSLSCQCHYHYVIIRVILWYRRVCPDWRVLAPSPAAPSHTVHNTALHCTPVHNAAQQPGSVYISSYINTTKYGRKLWMACRELVITLKPSLKWWS